VEDVARWSGGLGDVFEEEVEGVGAHLLGGDVGGGEWGAELFGPLPGGDADDGEVAGYGLAGVLQAVLDAGECGFVDGGRRGDLGVFGEDSFDALLACR